MKIKKLMLNEDTLGAAVERDAKELNAEVQQIKNGDVEDALDDALEANMLEKEFGGNEWVNVLLVGSAGIGKTARAKAWCKKHGLNMYSVDCKTLDTTDLGGAMFPVLSDDKRSGKAIKLPTDMLDQLDKPNSVLFLDEYNRARSDVRGTLLTLVNDHELITSGVEGGIRYFPNFLFTIAAINPPNASFDSVDELDPAELGRFGRVDITADVRNNLQYLTNLLTGKINKAKEIGNHKAEMRFSGQLAIATKLLKDRRFEFDGPEEEARCKINQVSALNPRSLSKLLTDCNGTKDNFLAKWNKYCNPDKKQLVELILSDYTDIEDKANSVFNVDDSQIGFKKKEKTAWDDISSALGI